MFCLNVGHDWKMAVTNEGIKSVVFLASGNTSQRLDRTSIPEFARTLLDPQLYLSGLNAAECSKACAKLASFPWFGVKNLPEFDSGEMKRHEWMARMKEEVKSHWPQQAPTGDDIWHACRTAIEYQERIGCSHVILPSPLIDERESEAETQAAWLDACLDVVQESDVTLPILATVAIDEVTLNDPAFDDAGFLDTVVDQITAREGIDGVYIVVAQTHRAHPFEMSKNVATAYARLCDRFSGAGMNLVLTNFADVFGLVCMAHGASGFCNGASQPARRLSLKNFSDKTRGIALPHLYSHRPIAEFRSETDLDVIINRRLLRRIRDETPYSQDLMDELDAGGSAANVPPWIESRNNTTAAKYHFIERLIAEHKGMMKTPARDRANRVVDWLESAASTMLFAQRRLGSTKLKGRAAPAEEWLDILEKI